MNVTLTPKQECLLGYALIFLISNFDEDNEEDLGMTQQEVIAEAVEAGLVKDESLDK